MYAEIVGTLGFLLACFLAYLEYNRRHSRLIMRVDYRTGKDQGLTFVYLYLDFVNPSDIGKTVYDMKINNPPGFSLVIPFYVAQINGNVRVILKDKTYIDTHWNVPAMLRTPLDIPEHCSKTAILFLMVEEMDRTKIIEPIIVQLFALDASGRRLCERNIIISNSIFDL
ncbi:MAG: hypothetical protein JW845_01895 [Dehalococcoidales bacterium]|nr:hypothetical protein [Dehalococcoidales bacterium]